MIENFEKAMDLLLKHEGGFTNDERDPGNKLADGRKGSTMLGVTQANWEAFVGHLVTQNDMKALTRADVSKFYKRKYWDAVQADQLKTGLDYLLFDFAVNAGPGAAIKLLQKTVGATPDGALGPKTLAAMNAMDAKALIDGFSAQKEAFYKSLKTFPTYGKGWLRRVAEVKIVAENMVA